jgi:peptide deformylase
VKKTKGTLLQVAEVGNYIFGKRSKEVEDINSIEIQSLIDNLILTVNDVDGVGISAVQVYHPVRLFILASHPNSRYPKAPRMKPTAIINPEIISHSKETKKDWEGCLSVPGIRGLVPRFKSIKVRYFARKGKIIEKSFNGFIARIFQHEYDHLEGITFLERMDNMKEIISEKEYQKMITKRKKRKTTKISKD